MLGELMRVKDGVAVAGSHGKTSTTTMVATILAQAGLDPTAIIGGKAKVFGSNARLGQGEVLVAEADESDGSFRHLIPMVAVITNIDREHMDHYGTEAALREAFVDFANKVPFYGLVVLCADNPAAAGLAADLQKRHVTYGLSAGDYRGEILSADWQGTRLRIAVRGKARGEVWVRMPGIHYAQNALAALCVSDVFEVSFPVYCEALASFAGVDRRFSVRGEAGGVLVVDDYGHHPTEIAATLAAARLFGRRLVVAFQPGHIHYRPVHEAAHEIGRQMRHQMYDLVLQPETPVFLAPGAVREVAIAGAELAAAVADVHTLIRSVRDHPPAIGPALLADA